MRESGNGTTSGAENDHLTSDATEQREHVPLDHFAQVLQMLEPLKVIRERRNLHGYHPGIDAIFQELQELQQQSLPTPDNDTRSVQPAEFVSDSSLIETQPSAAPSASVSTVEVNLHASPEEARQTSASCQADLEVEGPRPQLLAGASACEESAPAGNVTITMAEYIAGVEERSMAAQMRREQFRTACDAAHASSRNRSGEYNSSSGSRSSWQEPSQESHASWTPPPEPMRSAQLLPEGALSSAAEIAQAAPELGSASIDQTGAHTHDRAEESIAAVADQPNRHEPPLRALSANAFSASHPEPASTQNEASNRFGEYMARVEARRDAAQSRRRERLVQLNAMLDQLMADGAFAAGGGSPPGEAAIDANTTTSTWTGPEDTACTICIEDFVLGQEVRTLRCGHVYHRECVDAWLRRSRLCCLCKQAIDSHA